MSPDAMVTALPVMPGVVAALSEGQRAIAHLVVLLAVPIVAGLVYLIRRGVRRPDQTDARQQFPEEH